MSNKTIKSLIIKFIKNVLEKYVPEKYVKIQKLVDKISVSSNRFDMIIIGIYLVLLISIKLLNIFFISDLNTNIDDYILFYNHLKKSVIFLYCIVNINTIDNLYTNIC